MKRIRLLMAALAAMVCLGAQAQTAADFANGKYIFQNVGSGRYLGPGNAWGTTASLIQFSHFNTLNKLSDGVYKIESQVTNGGTKYYMGVDGNLFLDNAGSNINIFDNGDGTYAMQVSGQSTYIGYDGSTTVIAQTLTDASANNAKWKIIAYDDVYADASQENPVDVTYMILDSNFDRNHRSASAWTMNASNQNLSGGGDSNRCAESWRSTFTLSQTVTVPNGYYKLRAQAALTDYAGSGANWPVVYLNDATVSFNEMTEGEASMSKMSEQFTAGKYFTNYTDVVTVTGQSITVGVRGTRTDTWCIWDNFQLLYLGPIDLSDYIQGLADAVAAAQAYESQLPAAVYANIASVITEKNIDYETGDEYSAAITAINNAVSTYATAAIVADYARYQSIKTAALAIAASIDTSDSDNAVAAATTTDAIDAAIATLRAAFLAELPNLTVPADPGYIDVTSVMVDNAGVHTNTDYWTIEGTPNGGYSFGVCNYGECEFYNVNFKFYQTLPLTPGTWEFGVTGFHRAGNHNTHFYAGDDKILIPGVERSVVNTMADAKTYFDNGNGKVALKFLIESAQDVEIGINNQDTETDKWTIFRDFTLKYYGAPDYSVYDTQWTDAVNAANEALEAQAYKYVSGSEKTAVTDAIDDAPDGSSKANYLEKIQTLEAATATFKAAAPSYNAWVLAKNNTRAIWDTVFGVADPTTAAEAAAGVNALKVAEYEHVLSTYQYGVNLGSWTTENAGDMTSQHWDGTSTSSYNEQADGLWGSTAAWSTSYSQTLSLPAGNYVFKVAGRHSENSVLTLNVKNGEDVIGTVNDFPAGGTGRGINKAGATSFDADDAAGFANGGNGYGWQWRYVKFELAEPADITISVEGSNPNSQQYQWVSFCNYTVQTDDADNVALMQALIDLNEAKAAATLTERTNKGTDVFQFDNTIDDGLWSAYSTAKANADAFTLTSESTSTAVAALTNALTTAQTNYVNNNVLVAPDANKRYVLTFHADGHDADGNAITFIAGGRTDEGGYGIKYLTATNASMNQALKFTSVGDPDYPNSYKVSAINVADGGERYITTRATYDDEDADKNKKLRTTDDASKAMWITIGASADVVGQFQLLNGSSSNAVIAHNGNNNNDMFTNNSANFTIAEATKASVAINTTAAGWGTIMLPFAAAKPEGVKVYSVSELKADDKELNLVEVETLEANKPYIIEGAWDATLEDWGVAGATAYTDGWLTGVYEATEAPVGSYVLQKNNDVVGFYRVAEGKQPTVTANRAYLTVPAAGAREAYFFGEVGTTGISTIDAVKALTGGNARIFNAAGVEQSGLQKGLNIVKKADGTSFKVMVK